jgi:REP element-mobilizing transposase RayT
MVQRNLNTKDLLKYEKDLFTFDRGQQLVEIMCYTLMPNHFHLLLTIHRSSMKRTDANLDNNISVFMKRLTSAYSKYYNYKYNRTGSLFEGKFKAEHVADSNYFKYLFSYIHLNPIKLIQSNWREVGIKDLKKINEFLNEYKYSSFRDYFQSPRKAGGIEKIVSIGSFLDKIPEDTDLSKEIFDWLNFKTIQLN